MAAVDPPDHLEVLVPLLLDDVPHDTLQLVVLVVPGGEDLAALRHDLLELLVGDVHESPGAQHLQQLGGHVAADRLHQPDRGSNLVSKTFRRSIYEGSVFEIAASDCTRKND